MRTIVYGIALFLLTACGFSLRGPVELPESMQTIAVEPDDPYRPLQRLLREELAFAGVTLTPRTPNSTVILILDDEIISRHTLSVSSDGDVNQERLTYIIGFTLVDNNNQVMIPKQTISNERVLNINPNQILSVNREERVLVDEMRAESVQQMLRRIAAHEGIQE